MDSDDYIAEYSINNLCEVAFEKNLDMIFFDIKRVTNEEEKKCTYKEVDINKIVTGREYFAKNNVNNGPWHYFIRKNFIKSNKLLFERDKYCEDGMFLITALINAKRVSYIRVDFYRYVYRKNSTTTKKNKKHNIKMIEDFMHTILYLNALYNKDLKENNINNFNLRLKDRINSYIFFMQIRMIRNRIGKDQAKKYIQELKKAKLYKYERLDRKIYPGIKYDILNIIFNWENLFYLLV